MMKLTDSYTITKILLNEVFNNILSNHIFNKKRNRYILFALLFVIYVAYYLLNVSQLNQIFITEEQTNASLQNMLFSSLTNVIIIISGFIYLIVTISFSLTNRMQYQLKILPFEKGSIWLGSILFKLLLGYVSFLIIFAIIIPLLNLFYFSLGLNLLVLVYCQLLFFFSISIYYFLFHALSVKMKLTVFNLNHILLVVFLFFYLFVFRFQIDQTVRSLSFELTILVVLGFIVLLAAGTLLAALFISKLQTSGKEDVYSSSDFYSMTRIPVKMNHLSLLFLGMIRNKLTLRLSGIVLLFFLLAWIDTRNLYTAMTTLVYLYPVISFSAIRYYSTTMSYRKMNPFYGLSAIKETLVTALMNVMINLPVIIAAMVLSGDYVKTTYYAFIIFESALMMGIIFPKNKSSVNEFSASILCVVLALSLYLISNHLLIFLVIFTVLTSIKYYLLQGVFTMKLTKFIFIGTVVYLVLFLIDYLVTLFSIDESGEYMSTLGLSIDMTMNEQELFTNFSLTPQVLVTFVSWLLIVCLVYLVAKRISHRRVFDK
ncbi:hypothetical protein [Halobacillus sp. A5]|uniref:hypothetical protein n=1 Tax=Halobacillus sp. A5 TaxID=2880263 RepID=UPI0020A6C1BD|nr:hypothetical protein [Halobacillus sp. A5]MCP3027074.1 hypothetical protein [Halobacillus sp. A5]